MADLPAAFGQNPMLSTWIRFQDDKVLVCTGKVELGQGISTAIAMIAAEELDVSLDQVLVQTGRTDTGPNEFITAGSMSIEGSGSAVRQAAADVRHLLVNRAAERFGVPADLLTVNEGVITNPEGNEQVSYWSLLNGEQLDLDATGDGTPKAVGSYRYVGKTATRVDLYNKVTGGIAYVQDMKPQDLHHARVVRPREIHSILIDVDIAKAQAVDDVVKVVVDGNFLAVVAKTEAAAVKAKSVLAASAQWESKQPAINTDTRTFLRTSDRISLLVEEGTPGDTPIPDEKPVDVKATYFKPFHMHGSIGTSAALAQRDGDEYTIYSHSQGPIIALMSIARILDTSPRNLKVIHRENAGCYGHNGADDAAMDAALTAKHVPGVPILLKWQREDEHLHEPYSTAMLIDVSAKVDGGRISYWNADIYSKTHMGRPRPAGEASGLLAAWQLETPIPRPVPEPGRGFHGGIHRNADPYYKFPERRIIKNLVSDTRIRTSSTRGLGAFANVFAIESFMDELAHHAGIDPLAFRLSHLDDERATTCLNSMHQALMAYEPETRAGELVGKGFSFARYKNIQTYAAVGIILTVNEETFDVSLKHAVIAADAGQVIDRDGLTNQLEGGLIQSASWTLKEQVQFDEEGAITDNWDTYPILTFPEIPTVETIIHDQPDKRSLGAGEATAGPTPAAISNAIFDATGLRIRDIPFLPESLRALALGSG